MSTGGGHPESAQVLTIREIATYLRLPLSTVYRLAERGVLPGHKVGRQWRFHNTILQDWFRQQAARPRATILVVDDEAGIREWLAAALQTGNRTILTATCGEEALEIADGTELHLVLLDLMMPGMSGLETFRKLHALSPELPVVFVTSYPESALMEQALKIGPFSVLNKPVDLGHLQKVVGAIVEA